MHRLKNDLASHYLRSISTRTLRSAGGTRIVFEAWHLYVLFSAARVILCISKRFTVTWRPIDTPPPVCITSSPFSHVTVGSGRPEMSQQDSTEQKKKKSQKSGTWLATVSTKKKKTETTLSCTLWAANGINMITMMLSICVGMAASMVCG